MVNWSQSALIFPGQGSQQVGMGADLAARFSVSAEVFAQADDILGIPFSKLMFEDPTGELDQTINTQPALYIHSIAMLRALESIHGQITPLAAAGHSLGELTALTAAGSLSFEQGLPLVRERARLMGEAGHTSPGGMVALLGADAADAQKLADRVVADTGLIAVVANDNCPGQIVLSGSIGAMDRAMEVAKEVGIRRVVRVQISVAAHSPLMENAASAFREALAKVTFGTPRYPIIANTTATPMTTPEQIVAELSAQLTGPVRWTDTILKLKEMGAGTFYEIGSKEALSGMVKRTDKEVTAIPINSAETLAALA
jgi:[acyl-carrier-protein] S-malonyltransferase